MDFRSLTVKELFDNEATAAVVKELAPHQAVQQEELRRDIRQGRQGRHRPRSRRKGHRGKDQRSAVSKLNVNTLPEPR